MLIIRFLTVSDLVDCKQSSDTEWESEDSLPLDRSLPLPPPDIVITPDRRSKIILERTASLDLTDDDHSDHNVSVIVSVIRSPILYSRRLPE